MRAFRLVLLLLTGLGLATVSREPANAQATEEWRSWNRAVEPFRIAGNLWYVGASDITSFLITTPAGLVILDGGFAETAPQILANVKKLGFDLKEVKYLLNSHAHMDHAGGLAELKRATGARLVASAEDAPALENGDRDDFAWGDTMTFPPVEVDRRIGDGDTVTIGGVTLVAHLTPGHTRGCTTWSLAIGDEDPRPTALFLCSVTAPGYRLVGNDKWPEIAAAFAATFRKLETLPCDYFLAAHGSVFDLEGKRKRATIGLGVGGGPARGPAAGPANPFLDSVGCRAYLKSAQENFENELARQRAAARP